MRLRSVALLLLGLGLTGCAAGAARPGSPASPAQAFAHRVATSALVLYWNCSRPAPGELRVAGVAQNPWYFQPIQLLEFELVGVGAGGRLVAQTTGSLPDFQLFTNQTSPFRLDLRTTGAEERFDLYYQYQFVEGESDAQAGPPRSPPRLRGQTNRNLVRDACSPTAHLAG